MKLRVAFIGCLDFSHAALDRVLAHPDAQVVGVVTRRASSFNADFRCLDDLGAGCPLHYADDGDQAAMADFLRRCRPDVIYCFGWSSLLKSEILGIPALGVVGYHPAALPANRGRHPIIWAIALGLDHTASTFFRMAEGADDGPILDQERLSLATDETALSLYHRLTALAMGQIDRLTAGLAAGSLVPRVQDHAVANTWRKRGRADGRIDWRMTAQAIDCLVRALSRPYVGAHCDTPEGERKVWRVRPGPAAPDNLEPGRVLSVDGDTIQVKCWGGSIILVEHEIQPLPPVGSCL